MNYAVILSVVSKSAPLAIGLNTMFQHLFGDVPSPILVGLIKDDLSPNCSGGITDLTSTACRSESQGIKNTILITNCWGFWTTISSIFLYILIAKKLSSVYYANIDDNNFYRTLSSQQEEDSTKTPLIIENE